MKKIAKCLLIVLAFVVLAGQGPCEQFDKLTRQRARALTVEEMIGQFQHEDPDVRRVMVLQVGEAIRGKDATARAQLAVNYLALLRADPQPLVRAAILSQLPEVMGEAALPTLTHAFIDPSPIVRRDAVASVGRLHNIRNVDFLVNLVRLDADTQVRVDAITALADYPEHPDTIPVLREAAQSPDDSLAIRARALLAPHIDRQGGGPQENAPPPADTVKEPGFWDKYFGWVCSALGLLDT